MRAAAGCLLLALYAAAGDAGPTADARHMRYERAMVLPAGFAGGACAVLDAGVFAHASSRAAEDLRVFDSGGAETPFDLTESSAAARATESAVVQNLGVEGGAVVFDLRMPARGLQRG